MNSEIIRNCIMALTTAQIIVASKLYPTVMRRRSGETMSRAEYNINRGL
jgi:hypothetical protein